MTTVGVLALQGGFALHAKALACNGMASRLIRREEDLKELNGIILPGGESTTMLTLLSGTLLEDALTAAVRAGTPALATCAGVILLAREVRRPTQRSLGLLDVAVDRNSYGRQQESSVEILQVLEPEDVGARHIEGVFIRAPRLTEVGKGVTILATRETDPVLIRQTNILAATFHPELSPGSPIMSYFAAMVRGEK